MKARHNALNTDTEHGVEMFLKSWWSKHYNRPQKDPILNEYTIFELMYEYSDKSERELAAEFNLELKADKIEEESEQETMSWIEEEERKEREANEAAAKKADEDWMIGELKKQHGDDFGEDLDLNFSDE